MARYHQIEASVWEDLQDLPANAKLLYIFSFSNPSVRDSGLYKITKTTILLATGLSSEQFEEALKQLEDKLTYDFDQKVMFVHGKLKLRLSGIKTNENLVKSINHDLVTFNKSFVTDLFVKKYEGAWKGLASPSLPIPLPLPKERGVGRDMLTTKNLHFPGCACAGCRR